MKFSLAPIAILSLSLFSSVTQAGTTFFHNDHLGTPQALTDENQQVVWRSEQEPFGEVTQTTNEVEQNLRFPGQYFDVETGLHYNYFRDYDSGTGRYSQSDPIGLIGGLSTYGYVQGNPLKYSDPFGLITCVMVTRGSSGFGNHAALFVERGLDGKPFIYDSGGDYSKSHGIEGFGAGVVAGEDANMEKFAAFHMDKSGDKTETECKATSAEEEQLFGDNASNQGSFPGACSLDASAVIAGSSSFPGVTGSIWFPGNFIGAAKK